MVFVFFYNFRLARRSWLVRYMTRDTWQVSPDRCRMTRVAWHVSPDTCRLTRVAWHALHYTRCMTRVAWHVLHDMRRMTHIAWHASYDTRRMARVTWHALHDISRMIYLKLWVNALGPASLGNWEWCSLSLKAKVDCWAGCIWLSHLFIELN